jgi:hypothetical protein
MPRRDPAPSSSCPVGVHPIANPTPAVASPRGGGALSPGTWIRSRRNPLEPSASTPREAIEEASAPAPHKQIDRKRHQNDDDHPSNDADTQEGFVPLFARLCKVQQQIHVTPPLAILSRVWTGVGPLSRGTMRKTPHGAFRRAGLRTWFAARFEREGELPEGGIAVPAGPLFAGVTPLASQAGLFVGHRQPPPARSSAHDQPRIAVLLLTILSTNQM